MIYNNSDFHNCVMCNSKWNIWNTQTKTVGNNQNDACVILNCASHNLLFQIVHRTRLIQIFIYKAR